MIPSLPRAFFKVLDRDDPEQMRRRLASAGIASESAPFVPLLGEPLLIKALEAGAWKCAGALARLSGKGTSVWGLADSIGQTAASVALERCPEDFSVSAFDEAAARVPDPRGALPLERALKRGLWKLAAALLDLHPEAAKAFDSRNRGMLQCACEPGYFDHENPSGTDAGWIPPPDGLLDALLLAGADPRAVSVSGFTALESAIVSGAVSAAGRVARAQAESDRAEGLEPFLFGGRPGVGGEAGALHFAAKRGDLPTIRTMLELGADPNAASNKLMTPLAVALGNGRLDAARALLGAGANPDCRVLRDKGDFGSEDGSEWMAPPRSAPNCALRGPDPEAALALLAEAGADPWARDEARPRLSPAELAVDRLPSASAMAIWDAAPPAAKQASGWSEFSVFDRAAKSKVDAYGKMKALALRGFAPAAFPDGTESRIVSRSRSRSVHDAPSYWIRHAAPDPFQLGDEESTITRPSLPGYLAATGRNSNLAALLRFDAEHPGSLGFADWLCGFYESICANAPLATIRLCRNRAVELSPHRLPDGSKVLSSDEGSAAEHLAWSSLSESKMAALGYPVPDLARMLSQASLCEASSVESCFGFVRPGLAQFAAPAIKAIDALAGNPNFTDASAVLRPGSGQSALASVLFASACSEKRQRSFMVEQIVDLLPELAKSCDPKSPWGRRPSLASVSWGRQLAWEEDRDAPSKERADPFGTIMENLLDWDRNAFARLVNRLPFPADPSKAWTKIRSHIASWRSLSLGADTGREENRSAFSAAFAHPRWRRFAVSKEGAEAIRDLHDPVLFDLLMDEIRRSGSEEPPLDSFRSLAKTHAARLSPTMVDRIVDAAGGDAERFAIANALVTSERVAGADDASPTAVSRLVRIVDAASPEDWRCALGRGEDLFRTALRSGNFSSAKAVFERAPDDVREGWARTAIPEWLLGKETELSRFPAETLAALFSGRAVPEGTNPGDARSFGRLAEQIASLRNSVKGTCDGQPAQSVCSFALSELCASRREGIVLALLDAGLDGFDPFADIRISDGETEERAVLQGPPILSLFANGDRGGPATVSNAAAVVTAWLRRGGSRSVRVLSEGTFEVCESAEASDDFDYWRPRRGLAIELKEGVVDLVDLLPPATRSRVETLLLESEPVAVEPALRRRPGL